MSSAICFNLNQSKILSSGDGLIHLEGVSTYAGLKLFKGQFPTFVFSQLLAKMAVMDI